MPGVSPITTHILDTAKGLPAQAVAVAISILEAGAWKQIGAGATNTDGRITDLLPVDVPLQAGVYKMRFDTDGYFRSQNSKGFYPYVEVTFEIVDTTRHYHIPLLLSPYGYSTYRGS